MLTMDSKLGEVYATPVGHDLLYKVLLQIGVSEKLITNPVVSSLKLKHLEKLTGKFLGAGFYDAFLGLLNGETDVPGPTDGPVTKAWWKEAVFYQIYPRSFCDANNDGMGDLQGIIQKLDYLKELGVDALWLSPIYESPQDDNGYDISDYYQIYEQFGTMEDFDELLAKVHEKGMRLIMDLVVNHTSDEHKWFREALADPDSPYRDYYIFRPADAAAQGTDDGTQSLTPPNNWTSFFAGSAWNYYEKEKLWGLHLFSKKQMDLNWDNPAVRDDVIAMINWWLDKGVDGFRMDVINYISKQPGLPQGDPSIGALIGYTGIENYLYGPRLHEYLKEIKAKAFIPHNAFSVGETPGMGLNMCRLLTGEERKELDMVFSFDHLETPGHVRFDDYRYDLNYLRDYMISWAENYGNNCWMSLFYNNHDNPRMISKINPDPAFKRPLALLLAVIQFTLKGTPFVYQGDEMGLGNYAFASIDEITDVEAKGYYKQFCETKTPQEAFATILAGTREHTRMPIPWELSVSDSMPQKVDDPVTVPAHLQQSPDTLVTEAYRFLIALRKANPALIYGDFNVLCKKKNRFVYERSNESTIFIVDCNLSDKEQNAYPVPEQYKLHFSAAYFAATGTTQQNTVDISNAPKRLAPYEARIWCYKKDSSDSVCNQQKEAGK